MACSTLTVSNNIRVLMNNSMPRVSQERIAGVIDLEQPQVSKRMRGLQSWRLDELDKIAAFFDVELTLLVDSDPSAVYRWLAEHGAIDLRDEGESVSTCNHPSGSYALRLFDPDGLPDVAHLPPRRTYEESPDLYVRAS